MTPPDLQTLISNGEDTRHQFKRDFSHVDGLAAELVAFANAVGGMLLIGVADNGVMDGQGRIWVKSGADKRQVTAREEMQRMFQKSGLIHADEIPAGQARVAHKKASLLARSAYANY